MKSKFSKIASSKKNTTIIDSVNDIKVICKVIHTGHVLTIDDINKNRSSKYSYLVF